MSKATGEFEHDPYDPRMFAEERMALANLPQYESYVKNRIDGFTPYTAFRRAFGPGYRAEDVSMYAEQIEQNPWFQNTFQQRLAEMPMDKLWNQKKSINSLLQMVHNPFVKCSTQLAAIKELNVLANITFVDENGKTRAVKNLNAFYESIPEMDEETAAARSDALQAAGIAEGDEESTEDAPEYVSDGAKNTKK
jgi:hypothetical protein